jgi:hypothetical protein
MRFESECNKCGTRITSRDGGATWRHDKAPKVKHSGYATGVMREI